MRDAKRLGRMIVVRERLLSVRRSELAQASAELVCAEDEASRGASILDETVQALVRIGDALPEELALRASTARAAADAVRRADAVCAERARQRAEDAHRAVEAKRDVRVLEELEARLSSVARRDEARREQTSTDETAASRTRRYG